jgi:predicted acetyltransferase
MEIRKITPDEVETVLKMRRYAFGDTSPEPHAADEVASAIPAEILAVFEDGVMAASLHCFTTPQSVRGVLKPMGGIGAVATDPEKRNRGFAREMMKTTLMEMAARGDVVSMLMPFKETFYAHYGYVTANANLTVKVPIPSMAYALQNDPAKAYTSERFDIVNGRELLQRFMRDVGVRQYHGLALFDNMPASMWLAWHGKCQIVVVLKDGQPRAMARFRKTGYLGTGELHVTDAYWTDPAARTALLSFFAAHRDQVGAAKFLVPFENSCQKWFRDLPFGFGTEVRGIPWMVRVLDPVEAVTALPAAERGEVALELKDEWIASNNAVFTFRSDGETLSGSRGGNPAMRLDIRGLSALIYGTLPLSEIVYRGWAGDVPGAPAALLESWFPPRVLFNTFYF